MKEEKKVIMKQIEKLTSISIVRACNERHIHPSNVYKGTSSLKVLTEIRDQLVDDILEALNEVDYE